MKTQELKILLASAGAALFAYFRLLLLPLAVLVAVMTLDYITGMVKAYLTASLSSRIGLRVIVKKLCYAAMVAVGTVVDYLVCAALQQTGLQTESTLFCGLLVTLWLIINELLSILENLAAIGLPRIPLLTTLLQRLKTQIDQTEKEARP